MNPINWRTRAFKMLKKERIIAVYLVLPFIGITSAILFASNAYAQSSSGDIRREPGEVRGLYYDGLSVPSIVLYSVLASIVVAVVFTIVVIVRTETKNSSKAWLRSNRHSESDGFSNKKGR